MVAHKKWAVYIADSQQIPHLMCEVGRLREKTFRKVGEGTGKPMVQFLKRYCSTKALTNLIKRTDQLNLLNIKSIIEFGRSFFALNFFAKNARKSEIKAFYFFYTDNIF